MELILRYFIAKNNKIDYSQYNIASEKLPKFIDKETANLISDTEFDLDKEIDLFKRTFDKLAEYMGDEIFRKYNGEKDKFEGAFSNSSYEAILVGVASNLDNIKWENFREKVKEMYSQDAYVKASDRGVKVINRFKDLNAFSREYYHEA